MGLENGVIFPARSEPEPRQKTNLVQLTLHCCVYMHCTGGNRFGASEVHVLHWKSRNEQNVACRVWPESDGALAVVSICEQTWLVLRTDAGTALHRVDTRVTALPASFPYYPPLNSFCPSFPLFNFLSPVSGSAKIKWVPPWPVARVPPFHRILWEQVQ